MIRKQLRTTNSLTEQIVYEQKEVFVIDEAANAQNDDPSDIETCKVVGRLQLVRNVIIYPILNFKSK